jgi:hypothetical protein
MTVTSIPDWPPGTVAVLVTSGARPHAIPVSALLRCPPHRVLVGLGSRRESLRRLRADPQVTLVVIARDLAVSLEGRAAVVDEALLDGVVAVEVEVEAVQDHDRPTFALQAGVRWRWTDPEAGERDAAVLAALAEVARGAQGGDAG